MLRTTPDLIGVLSTAEAKRRAASPVREGRGDRSPRLCAIAGDEGRLPARRRTTEQGQDVPARAAHATRGARAPGRLRPRRERDPEQGADRRAVALRSPCCGGAARSSQKTSTWRRARSRSCTAKVTDPGSSGMDPMACAIVEQWLQAPAQARREGRAEGVLRDQQAHDRRAAALQLRPEHGQGDWAACGDREACAPAWPATYPCIRARRRARRPAPHTTPARSRQPRRYCPLYRASEPLRGGGGNSRAILASSGFQQLPVSAGRPIRLPPAVDSEQRLVGLLTVAGLFDAPGLLHRGAGPAPHPGLEVRQAPRRFAARLSGQLGSEVGHVVPELLQRDGARGALRHAGCCSRAEQTDPPRARPYLATPTLAATAPAAAAAHLAGRTPARTAAPLPTPTPRGDVAVPQSARPPAALAGAVSGAPVERHRSRQATQHPPSFEHSCPRT